jgi:hypothetical protein
MHSLSSLLTFSFDFQSITDSYKSITERYNLAVATVLAWLATGIKKAGQFTGEMASLKTTNEFD